MGRVEQNQPIMAGSTEATDEERRDGLAAQVESDHVGDAAGRASEDFEERARQAGLEGDEPSTDDDPTPIQSREPA